MELFYSYCKHSGSIIKTKGHYISVVEDCNFCKSPTILQCYSCFDTLVDLEKEELYYAWRKDVCTYYDVGNKHEHI